MLPIQGILNSKYVASILHFEKISRKEKRRTQERNIVLLPTEDNDTEMHTTRIGNLYYE